MAPSYLLKYCLKAGAVLGQLATLYIITILLDTTSAATILSSIAISQIVSLFTSAGFTKYSFRYIRRKSCTNAVFLRQIQYTFSGSLLLLTISPFLTQANLVTYPSLFFIIALGSLQQPYIDIFRYIQISNGRIVKTLLSETIQPIVCSSSLLALYITGFLTIESAALCYFIAYTSSTFGGYYLSSWKYSPPQNTNRNTYRFKKLYSSTKRTFPVFTDALAQKLIINSPTLIFTLSGNHNAVITYAWIQRLYALSATVLSVITTSNLNKLYSIGNLNKKLKEIFSASFLYFLFVLVAIQFALFFFRGGDTLNTSITSLINFLENHQILIATANSTYFTYIYLSMLALGQNSLNLRVKSSITCLMTTIICYFILIQIDLRETTSILYSMSAGYITSGLLFITGLKNEQV